MGIGQVGFVYQRKVDDTPRGNQRAGACLAEMEKSKQIKIGEGAERISGR